MDTTCQICERVIKSSTGVIAHHGYQRSNRGSGWQTSSCAGTRELPFEVSCDKLPPTIKYIKNYIIYRSNQLKDFIKNPPEVLTSRYDVERKLNRPEDFVPEIEGYIMPFTYENEYHDQKYVMEKSIKEARNDLTRLKNRLKSWKPKIKFDEWRSQVRK